MIQKNKPNKRQSKYVTLSKKTANALFHITEMAKPDKPLTAKDLEDEDEKKYF
jgi:hypothetical protein